MDRSSDRSPQQPYLPMRFTYYGRFSYYYAYGNTPAEDLLEHVHFVEERMEPSILSLGCGDIRSPFYTLWKHFDPSLSKRHFSGVRFVLNDISAAVLARDVLFLYLAVNMPPWSEEEVAKQWISSLWAIWYCHELLPDHERTLKEALDALVSWSGTVECWESSKENPLRQLVSFTNVGSLKQIKRIWEMWRTKSFGSVASMTAGRMKNCHPNTGLSPFITDTCTWLRATGWGVHGAVYDALSHDYTHYEQSGSAFAEECFSLCYSTSHTVVNPTLYEREDGLYSLHYASNPYETFIQGLFVSKSQIQQLGMDLRAAGQPLIVDDDSFQRHPLLSNSVQQFSIWVSSAAVTLRAQSSRMKPNISFTFDCSNCIHICKELQNNPKTLKAHIGTQPAFDVIYTSNLIDRLTPPVLISVCKPLLKKTGLLLTTTFLYRSAAPSAEQYLEDLFGFTPELLPVITGIRCIGHDGRFTDATSIVPMPVPVNTILLDLKHSRYDKVLIWERVDALPMKIGALDMQTHYNRVLHSAIRTSVTLFYDSTPSEQGLVTRTALCTETAISTILSFASQLDDTVDISDHRFWDGLCSLVRDDAALRPFLVHLQTQALLHCLHFHLTLSETECPLCLKRPVEEVVSQFSVEFDPRSMESISPFFLFSIDTPEFPLIIYKAPIKTHQIYDVGSLGPDDHIVDSVQGHELPAGKVRLTFFFPTQYIKEDYFVSIVRYTICPMHQWNGQHKCAEKPVALLSRKLAQLRVSYQHEPYFFRQAGSTRAKSTSSSLGSVLSHCGDADHMETLLSLSPKALSVMKAAKINMEQLSPSRLNIACGKHHFAIGYPYSVDLNSTRVQISHSKGTMKVISPRRSCHVYEEKPVFFVNPDHMLSLPTLQVSDEAIFTFSSMQFTKQDRQKLAFPQEERVPMVNVKESFAHLFRHSQDKFFTFASSPDCTTRKKQLWASMLVNRRASDTQRCSPVLDVSYITEETFTEEIRARWCVMMLEIESSMSGHREVAVEEEEWQVLKQVLKHFANCTRPTSKNPSHILRKHGLDKYHTRAVLYPLYFDQDALSELKPGSFPASSQSACYSTSTASDSSTFTISSSESIKCQNKCSYCGSLSDKLKRCTGCGGTWYCGKECQARHWKQHKTVCNLSTHTITTSTIIPSSSTAETISTADAKDSIPHSSVEDSTECNYCGSQSDKLKRCTGCEGTWYCGKECQTKHWKQHKTVCKPPVIPIAMALPSKCASCGKDTANLKRCACQFVAYCSKECQRNDWTRHRTNCTATRSRK